MGCHCILMASASDLCRIASWSLIEFRHRGNYMNRRSDCVRQYGIAYMLKYWINWAKSQMLYSFVGRLCSRHSSVRSCLPYQFKCSRKELLYINTFTTNKEVRRFRGFTSTLPIPFANTTEQHTHNHNNSDSCMQYARTHTTTTNK